MFDRIPCCEPGGGCVFDRIPCSYGMTDVIFRRTGPTCWPYYAAYAAYGAITSYSAAINPYHTAPMMLSTYHTHPMALPTHIMLPLFPYLGMAAGSAMAPSLPGTSPVISSLRRRSPLLLRATLSWRPSQSTSLRSWPNARHTPVRRTQPCVGGCQGSASTKYATL